MSKVVSGLIADDHEAAIVAELEKLQDALGRLAEVIAADRAALKVVERVERLPDILPDGKMVVAIYTPERGLVTSLS